MFSSESPFQILEIIRYSRDNPNSGRRRIPIRQPGRAPITQTRPARDLEAPPQPKAPMLQPKPRRAPHPTSRPPIPAASNERNGGHAVAANGLLAAAAAMAPNS